MHFSLRAIDEETLNIFPIDPSEALTTRFEGRARTTTHFSVDEHLNTPNQALKSPVRRKIHTRGAEYPLLSEENAKVVSARE